MTELPQKPVEDNRAVLESALERVDEGIVGSDGDPRCIIKGWYKETIRADFVEAFCEDDRRRMAEERAALGKAVAQSEQFFQPPTETIEKYRISIRVLIVPLFLLAGAGIGGKFLYETQKKRLKATCELLQKGQPLPLSPNEVQMPDVDSLYRLIEICEQNHNVSMTYGCAAEGVLHTAELDHEPSEISEELEAEAKRVAKEVKCNQ